MKYHNGIWCGKKTDELEILSEQYVGLFGVWPDGYEDIDINRLDYDDYITVIKICIDKKIEIGDVLPDEFFLEPPQTEHCICLIINLLFKTISSNFTLRYTSLRNHFAKIVLKIKKIKKKKREKQND